MTAQVEKLMKALDLTEAEAIQLMEDDKAVDRMKDSEVNADLTPDQQAAAKKARQADRKKPFVPDLKKRERKENPTKRDLIALLAESLNAYIDGDLTITNPEREINFLLGGVKYKVVLSAPRK